MASKNFCRFLIEMFTFILLFETCEGSMCPAPCLTECNRSLNEYYDLIHVYSPLYKVNFLCDMKTDGGGWIIFQRRVHNYITFERGWDDYKNGFGNKCKDYWLGNEHVHQITTRPGKKWELRIDMRYKKKAYYAVYSNFSLEGESRGYQLRYDNFVRGDAGDMLYISRNMLFSTPEMDNDYNGQLSCAYRFHTGFWFDACPLDTTQYILPPPKKEWWINLNGIFHEGWLGVIWGELTSNYDSLDSVEMKMRHY